MLAPAYFSPNYTYFDQLLQTVKNKTTVLILVFKESSRRVSRADGGGRKTLCIKIGYKEPRGAESREGSSTPAESFRVTQYSILIGCRLG